MLIKDHISECSTAFEIIIEFEAEREQTSKSILNVGDDLIQEHGRASFAIS